MRDVASEYSQECGRLDGGTAWLTIRDGRRTSATSPPSPTPSATPRPGPPLNGRRGIRGLAVSRLGVSPHAVYQAVARGRELIEDLQRFAWTESYDEQAVPGLDSEAVDFRVASELCAPLQRQDLETF